MGVSSCKGFLDSNLVTQETVPTRNETSWKGFLLQRKRSISWRGNLQKGNICASYTSGGSLGSRVYIELKNWHQENEQPNRKVGCGPEQRVLRRWHTMSQSYVKDVHHSFPSRKWKLKTTLKFYFSPVKMVCFWKHRFCIGCSLSELVTI